MLGSHMVVVSDSAQVIPDKDESALEEAASHEMGHGPSSSIQEAADWLQGLVEREIPKRRAAILDLVATAQRIQCLEDEQIALQGQLDEKQAFFCTK